MYLHMYHNCHGKWVHCSSHVGVNHTMFEGTNGGSGHGASSSLHSGLDLFFLTWDATTKQPPKPNQKDLNKNRHRKNMKNHRSICLSFEIPNPLHFVSKQSWISTEGGASARLLSNSKEAPSAKFSAPLAVKELFLQTSFKAIDRGFLVVSSNSKEIHS